MTQDFMIETRGGWTQGRKGDWLLRVDGQLWAIVSNDDFIRIYRETKSDDCIGPCDASPGKDGA